MKYSSLGVARLYCALMLGGLCSCSGDFSHHSGKTAFLDGVETTQIKTAVVTEQLHGQVTARLDEDGTRRLLWMIGHGRPPKATKVPYQDPGYVPVSYIVTFSGTKPPLTVVFFGRCESCFVNRNGTFDFGDADAKMLTELLDPKHLWIY